MQFVKRKKTDKAAKGLVNIFPDNPRNKVIAIAIRQLAKMVGATANSSRDSIFYKPQSYELRTLWQGIFNLRKKRADNVPISQRHLEAVELLLRTIQDALCLVSGNDGLSIGQKLLVRDISDSLYFAVPLGIRRDLEDLPVYQALKNSIC